MSPASQPASQLYPVGENKELAATLLQQPSSTHSPLSARPGTETEKERERETEKFDNFSPGSVKLQTLTFMDEERQLKMNGCFTRATN